MKSNYYQNKAEKAERYKQLAAKNEGLSNSHYNVFRSVVGNIPMGQPILVGHHSERRHRRDLDRADNNMRKSVEADQKAQYYTDKAHSLETNTAISSDAPDALDLLKTKLKHHEQLQEFMKNTNVCIRKNDKTAFLLLPGATEAYWSQLTAPSYNGMGFPHFRLTNNNAKIKTIKERIAALEALLDKVDITHEIGSISVIENYTENRVQIIFPGKPSDNTRKSLKSNGFRWSPTQGAWQRHINSHAVRLAKTIAETFKDNF